MKKILVLGSAGMLGYAVYEYFTRAGYDVTGIERSRFDAFKSPPEDLLPLVKNSDLVINCIGIIRQVIDKFPAYEVVKVNGMFPRNLAIMCASAGNRFIHITTDCVYSGRTGNYSEHDLFDADDLYGASKLAGEQGNCMILRTSIIGPERNSNRSLLGWAIGMKGKNVNGFTNHFWNGVTTLQFARIAENILVNDLYEEGLFHVHSPDTVSKFGLLEIFNRLLKLGLVITPVESGNYCNRSLSTIYPLSGKLSIPNIRQQLQDLKEFFKLSL